MRMHAHVACSGMQCLMPCQPACRHVERSVRGSGSGIVVDGMEQFRRVSGAVLLVCLCLPRIAKQVRFVAFSCVRHAERSYRSMSLVNTKQSICRRHRPRRDLTVPSAVLNLSRCTANCRKVAICAYPDAAHDRRSADVVILFRLALKMKLMAVAQCKQRSSRRRVEPCRCN